LYFGGSRGVTRSDTMLFMLRPSLVDSSHHDTVKFELRTFLNGEEIFWCHRIVSFLCADHILKVHEVLSVKKGKVATVLN
jgi:hypothetical protein